MQYGFFDDLNKEYVITTPKTPVKWINYVGGLSFGGFVDNTGGGLLCKGDPATNRIVKYIAQMPASDFKGQTLYARVRELDTNAASQLITPYFVPGLQSWQSWECRIGLGYTRFLTKFGNLEFDIKIFCPAISADYPMAANREIRDIRVTNRSAKAIELDLVPIVEYTHFDALKQLTNADWVPQTMQSQAHPENDGKLLLCQYAFMKRKSAENYFTSNMAVSSFESDRKKFLGDNEYGTWAHPLALDQAELSNTEALRGDNIGALLHRMGRVEPGASVRLITQLGQEADPSLPAVHAEIDRWRDGDLVDQAFADLAAFWENYLSAMQVETPDPRFNTMVNVHNPRQCFMTKNWSRYLSLYQLGFGGDRGIGFRDSSQDIMGVMSHMPTEAIQLGEKLLSVQKRNGSAMHQFHPISMQGSVGDSHEYKDRPKYYSDDHLWIVLAVLSYVRETGDLAFLQKQLPFYEKTEDGEPLEQGSVLEHLKRAIAFTAGDTGAHGLPLLGFADWNDTVNLPTGAESLFTANLYGRALREMIRLAEQIGDDESLKLWTGWYEVMKGQVNAAAWDGEWYVRYFDHDGSPIGSHTGVAGKIWMNSQTWAVISGFSDGVPAFGNSDRSAACMKAVNKFLNTAYGLKLSWPGYNGYDPKKGGVTTYPPGAKENGGIFLHTNPWAMIAECINGNGDLAYQYYLQINPAARNECLDLFECEPYVYPQNILGDEHSQFGLGRNSWLSGTASWAYQAASQYILGVRADYKGLIIDPCIPSAWTSFVFVRKFRGAEYAVMVDNPKNVCRGVVRLIVDGKEISPEWSVDAAQKLAGQTKRKHAFALVPAFSDGERHEVRISLG